MVSRAPERPTLTTTSYAILGLLAVQPWTTYGLAQQMERTLNRVWPRARSKIYEEPKKLVAHGFATASEERVGRRPRTVYRITARGRRALADWLGESAPPPALESEQLTKLFFADFGTKASAVSMIEEMRTWASDQLTVFADVAQDYLTGAGPFPQRLATNVVVARYLVDFYEQTIRWADWALNIVQSWPDDPGTAQPDLTVLADIARRGR
jgi:DNA-binding PadR family transcriptional regulator